MAINIMDLDINLRSKIDAIFHSFFKASVETDCVMRHSVFYGMSFDWLFSKPIKTRVN
jgi:hypothetical protein